MTGAFIASIAIKATVILAIGLGARRVLRRSRASVRHLLLLGACAAVLAMPVAALVLPVVAIPLPYPGPVTVVPVVLEAPPDVALTPVAGDVVTEFATGSFQSASIAQWVLLVAVMGAAVALLPLIAGVWQTRRLRAAARPWPDGRKRIERLMMDTHSRRRIDVLVHDDLSGPVTCGVWPPVLLFPAEAQHWKDDDFEGAAIHELEHVRRYDWATDCFARVVCAVYWFHPLVWVTWRQLRLESERAADDAVVRAREGTAYADLLVTLAERLDAGQHHCGIAMAGRRDLPLRIQALLDASLPRARAGRRIIAMTVLLTAVAVLGIAPLGPLTEVRTAVIERDARPSPVSTNHVIRPRPEVNSAERVPPPRAPQQAALPRAPIQPDAPPPSPAQQSTPPLSPPQGTGGRLFVVLFDVVTPEVEDLRTATTVGVPLVIEKMANADPVALVTSGTRLRVVMDFTSNRGELRAALESSGLLNETAPNAGVLGGNPISQAADAASPSEARIRAMTTLCGMLRPFEQRKTVLYFSSGSDVKTDAVTAELRAATMACFRANVSIYTVDVRGLRPAVADDQNPRFRFRVPAVF